MARPRPTTAVDDGRTRSGIPGRADGNANTDAETARAAPTADRIAPPTKNGHAPPPTESRKSSQSVNLSGVRACFNFAIILPPEPKSFGFPEAARRSLMKRRRIASWHRYS
ncbi:hypothetical protein KEM48_014628 [Puccinia striiformis f. sp. tritici PST-130]|nr:hypothetical protein KEM48_014628 [Puccinia striiformis f. sp. tritici PST-130]